VVGLMCLQIVIGVGHGLSGGRKWHSMMLRDQRILADASQASDPLLLHTAYYWPQDVRRGIPVISAHHLSLFSTNGPETFVQDNPYYVARASQVTSPTLPGVSVSRSPKYGQNVSFAANDTVTCVTLSPGTLVAVELGSSGSIRVAAKSLASTVEVLFSNEGTPNAYFQAANAERVDFAEVHRSDRWLNVPPTRFKAVFVEATAGTLRVCPPE
jgi:hypothetical protein